MAPVATKLVVGDIADDDDEDDDEETEERKTPASACLLYTSDAADE